MGQHVSHGDTTVRSACVCAVGIASFKDRRKWASPVDAVRLIRFLILLVAATAATACVPLVVPRYSADPAQGKPLFSSCAINKNVPDGIELQIDGVQAQVKLQQAVPRGFVEVRLDVPTNKTVQLQGDVVEIDLHNGRPPIEARYPNISLVDSPGMHSFDTPPALARYMVPVQTPMLGGAITAGDREWPKHYWMAARVDTEGADAVTITLPGMLINGLPVQAPKLNFRRSLFAVLAPLNC